ncbi:TM2 domain-containing protein almondex isoform X1 [Neodiprion virginianus]|uniref:TM2 domain-containing protein almondex isoform X1 n=1 Tax=Neodiprion fabricii TaxID=2872261 RepID=UPI001ED8EB3C|nr:TM2 domain-containing protein almondex isoform X1 [Neodiprion fabricii]XP_046618767.1 TM2 domain-containing protein almondex isoform X1 [Neodiprion virginianus]
MNIVRINKKNVFYIIFALLLSTVKEAQMGGMADFVKHEREKRNTNSTLQEDCPADKQCSELSVECLNCTTDPGCIYGKTITSTCTVRNEVKCVGEQTFKKDYICRYCYQTEHWEHKCHQKATCSSVASPQQFYRTNCTVNGDIVCLGHRRFMKNLPCNWIGGYRWSTALILSITLGGFGADRFYLGHWQEGTGKLFSFGGLGVWTLIDVVLISMRYLGPADGSLYI